MPSGNRYDDGVRRLPSMAQSIHESCDSADDLLESCQGRPDRLSELQRMVSAVQL
jgi:hypothetical protein